MQPWDRTHLSQHPIQLFRTVCKALFLGSPFYRVLLNLVHSLKSPFKWRFYIWEKPETAGSQISCRGATHLSDAMFHQNVLHYMWRMARCTVMMKLQSCSSYSIPAKNFDLVANYLSDLKVEVGTTFIGRGRGGGKTKHARHCCKRALLQMQLEFHFSTIAIDA